MCYCKGPFQAFHQKPKCAFLFSCKVDLHVLRKAILSIFLLKDNKLRICRNMFKRVRYTLIRHPKKSKFQKRTCS